MVGQTARVLVEQTADRYPDHLLGTADNTRSVMFKGEKDLMGQFVLVKIDEFISPHMVKGELVEVLG